MNNSIGIYPVYQALVFVVTDTGLCHDRHQCLKFSLQNTHYQCESVVETGS